MTTHSKAISHLSQELQQWMWEKIGAKAPSASEIETFISSHLDKYGKKIIAEQFEAEDAKIPALLKKKPETEMPKRMRELAGIPHRGNFV